MMTERERILAVYNGQKPDRVPFMLDLSHWYLWKTQQPWDLNNGYWEVDHGLIETNRRFGAGNYLANQSHFWNVTFGDDVKTTTVTNIVDGNPEIVWTIETPLGTIQRIRVWEPTSYSWAIKKWGVTTEQDLKVLAYALSSQKYEAIPENYKAWEDAVGDEGVIYMIPGYSAMGQLLNYWMGVENTIYATYDMEEVLEETVNAINNNLLTLVEMIATKFDAPVAVMGDNFSSDVQSPRFIDRWSRDYYTKACEILHKHGKKVAVHVDGKLKGLMKLMREIGFDAIDAVTPGSVGGMTPAEIREEAGPDLILSGGIPNELWYPYSTMEQFENAVKEWLALKDTSTALISAAGDQVPPGAEEAKIIRMGELVNEFGKY